MFAEIVTIGDELTRGEIVDTNSSWLAGRLWDQGVIVRWMTSCRDDLDDMRRALTDAVGRADVVLVSGGLGPTEDDLTVDVVAGLLGVEPAVDPPARARLEQWMAARARPISAINLRQVRVPSGARIHPNPVGFAPGFEVALGGVPVVCMPGVPRELHGIFDGSVAGGLAARQAAAPDQVALARRIFRVFGRAESQLSEALRGLLDGAPGASLHYQVRFPETLVKLVVADRDGARAAATLAALEDGLRARIGRWIYGVGEAALPAVVAAALTAGGRTVAVAESCTGGMLGQLLTDGAGASAFFLGGAIVYANAEKVRALGVPAAVLAEHGAVSEACVRAMATGVCAATGADLGVAVSGIAGPDGGTPDKPVGTVWLAVADRGEERTMTFHWPGSREQVRTLAAWWALAMLRDACEVAA
ncbi:MAG: CinA family nicotinamide mononucleotide deamidase-related protein [Myxococcales bacterium]|nr:CinA family nicotinamide mononucleotide deamidase-related protein [Myxococcales bacterium]